MQLYLFEILVFFWGGDHCGRLIVSYTHYDTWLNTLASFEVEMRSMSLHLKIRWCNEAILSKMI